jgi:hypothetical protein
VAASVIVSTALLGTALFSAPRVTLEHVRLGQIADAGRTLETPKTLAAVSRRNLCDLYTPPPCDKPLPREGYLKLQYLLGLNRVSSYCIRISVEPAESIGLADLKTDPALELEAFPNFEGDAHKASDVRAWTDGNYDVHVASRRDDSRGELTGTIEIRLLGRELGERPPGPTPTLRATFATDVEMKETVDALTGCWSLMDGSPLDCGVFASSGSR